MRFFALIVMFMAATASAQYDPRRPYPSPMPPVTGGEQVLMREVNQVLAGQSNYLSVNNTVALHHEAHVSSVIVIASSADSSGILGVTFEGRTLTERVLSNRLEVIQVPVNARLERGRELTLVGSGNVYVAQVGVTYFGHYHEEPRPRPVGPTCEVLGAGSFNNLFWNYRVRVQGQVLDAADNLDQIIDKVRRLTEARVCEGPMPAACELHGAGSYRNLFWNFRIQLGAEIVDAVDNLDRVLDVTRKLQAAGLCQPDPANRCGLQGPGSYRNLYWNHRITIGDRVVDATDNLESATRILTVLRNASYCY